MEERNIKVLLVSAVPPPIGGDAIWAAEYLEYCERCGYKIRVVNTSILGKRALTVSDTWNIFDEIKRCLRIWKGINEQIKRFSPDIIHMNTNCSAKGVMRDLISAFFIRRNKKTYILHCHCNVPDQINGKRLGILCLKKLIQLSSKTLVLNRDSLNYLEYLQNGNYEILPNFIKNEFIVENRDYNEKIEQIAYIGHIKKTKGIDELLETAKYFPKIKFILAGPITEDYEKEEMIAYSNGNVIVLGPVVQDKVKELLDKSDIFAFPSYTEGFSRALLEAMARGVPIIATDVGANREMLEGKGGCIVQKGDASGIIDAIQYMEPVTTRALMGQWSIQKVTNSYSIKSVINRLYTIYQGALDEKNL